MRSEKVRRRRAVLAANYANRVDVIPSFIGAALMKLEIVSSEPRRKRILCVDDDCRSCSLIAAVFRAVVVDHASSAERAWKLYEERDYSLVFVSQKLKDETGVSLCERIRKSSRLTPVIILTSDLSISESEAISAGAQRLITKDTTTFVDQLLEA